jgi:hypothetical protein
MGPPSPRPNAVIDLDDEVDDEVADDFLEGLAVNKNQMEQELDKVLKMMKEIEVSPPNSSKAEKILYKSPAYLFWMRSIFPRLRCLTDRNYFSG